MRLISFLALCGAIQAVPLWFEPNYGQFNSNVQFQSRNFYLNSAQASVLTSGTPVSFTLEHANRNALPEALDPLPGISNYFVGNDAKKWRAGIPHFARVRYHDVYPGIDTVYYINPQGGLEYDFIVAAGADPHIIQISYNVPVHRDSKGDLLIGQVTQRRPRIHQNGREIVCDYIVRDSTHIEVALAEYDHAQAVTIDPVIEYSTYLGGPAYDWGTGIKADPSGYAYVTGTVKSPSGPGVNPFQQISALSQDVFVLKVTPTGDGLVYYDVIGGSFDDYANRIVVDSTGAAWIAGNTQSPDFAVKNATQPEYGGGYNDAFIAKISKDGRSLLFSTFLGGIGSEYGYGLAIDHADNVYIGLQTNSRLSTKNAFQQMPSSGVDGYVAKLSSSGQPIYATFLGGSGFDALQGIAVDRSGSLYVTGFTSSDDFPVVNAYQRRRRNEGGPRSDNFLTKFSPDGLTLIYSTFGVGGYRLAIDSAGNAYAEGFGGAVGEPPMNGFQTEFGGGDNDKVIYGLAASGNQLIFATFLGGSGSEYGTGDIAIGPDGSIYIAGHTTSKDFPVKNPLQQFAAGGQLLSGNAFIARISADGKKLLFSTPLGGSQDEWAEGIDVAANGIIYITGISNSSDLPLVNPLQKTFGGGSDILIAKILPDVIVETPLSVSPDILPFRFVIGGPIPPIQSVQITSPLPTMFTASSDATWLKVGANATLTPATLNVSVLPAGLKPGPYMSPIQIDAATSVQVSLTVLDTPPQATSVIPTIIPLGSSDTVVTVMGSGFVTGSFAHFVDSSVALPTAFVNSQTVRVTLPAGLLTLQSKLSLVIVNPQSAPSTPLVITIGEPVAQFTPESIVNAASFATGPVAPGEIVTIFGTNLTDKVTFDNLPATLVYVSAAQVSVTVPYSITGPTTMVQVSSSAPVKLDVAPSAPGIFAAVPAADNVLVLYATGCGQLTTGELPRCVLPVTATVNDQPATVFYAGIAPGLVQGANQINIQLPDGLASGPLTIVLTAGDSSSKRFSLTVP